MVTVNINIVSILGVPYPNAVIVFTPTSTPFSNGGTVVASGARRIFLGSDGIASTQLEPGGYSVTFEGITGNTDSISISVPNNSNTYTLIDLIISGAPPGPSTPIPYLAVSSNLSDVANAATAFGNIKQAATTSATGVVQIATQEEVDAGTDASKSVSPYTLAAAYIPSHGKISSTSDGVVVFEGSQLALGGDSGADGWPYPYYIDKSGVSILNSLDVQNGAVFHNNAWVNGELFLGMTGDTGAINAIDGSATLASGAVSVDASGNVTVNSLLATNATLTRQYLGCDDASNLTTGTLADARLSSNVFASSRFVLASAHGIVADSPGSGSSGTEEVAAWNTLIDSVSAAGGGIIIQHGKSLINGTVKIKTGVKIVGLTRDCGFVRHPSSHNCLLSTDLTGATISNENVALENLTFYGNFTGDNSSIRFEAVPPYGYSVSPTTGTLAGGSWYDLIWFGSVKNFEIRNVSCIDAVTYGFKFSNAYHGRVYNPIVRWTDTSHNNSPNQNHDSIHFWGTCDDIIFYGAYLENGDDDNLALNTDEQMGSVAAGYTDTRRGIRGDLDIYGNAMGDIMNVTFYDSIFKGSSQGIRLIGYGFSSSNIKNVRFINTEGSLSHIDMQCDGVTIDYLEIKGWNVTGTNGIVLNGASAGTVRLEGIPSGVSVSTDAGTKTGDYFSSGSSVYPTITGSGSASVDFGALSAGDISEQGLTCTGAKVGDLVLVAPPVAPPAGLIWSGYVSAADSVTLRGCAITSVSAGANTWGVQTLQGPAAPVDLLSGLIAYWNLDESSGVRADATGNGWDLTPTAATGSTTGALNDAALFAGSTALQQTGSFSLGNAVSISAWVSGTGSGVIANLGMRDDVSNNSNYRLIVIGTDAVWQIDGDGNNITGTFTNDGSWHHLVATYDGTTSTLYIDGVSVGTMAASVTFSADLFQIGASFNSAPTLSGQATGAADEVAMYERALNSSEVTSLYNGGTPLPYSSF